MGVLDKVFCICYPVQFCKDKSKDVLSLLDCESEVNAIALAYAAHLGLTMRATDGSVQKIDRFLPTTYGIIIVTFQIVNKLYRFWVFQKTFLLANISMDVILGIFFPIFSNANIQFAEKELT